MMRQTATFVGLALLFGAGISRAQERAADEPIKVETKLVSIPTIVSDRDGRYIPNLAL